MRLITIIALVVIAGLLIAWDVIVAIRLRNRANNPDTGATISEVVHGFARKYLLLPIAVGVLLGHFFWPQVPEPSKEACAQVCERGSGRQAAGK